MDNATIPTVEAEVTLLTAAEGGRRATLKLDHTEAFYRPHLVVGDPRQREAIVDAKGVGTEDYLGVQFHRAALELEPGASARVRMHLMFYPACRYERLQPGTTFTIREGRSVVGYGTILRRDDHGAI